MKGISLCKYITWQFNCLSGSNGRGPAEVATGGRDQSESLHYLILQILPHYRADGACNHKMFLEIPSWNAHEAWFLKLLPAPVYLSGYHRQSSRWHGEELETRRRRYQISTIADAGPITFPLASSIPKLLVDARNPRTITLSSLSPSVELRMIPTPSQVSLKLPHSLDENQPIISHNLGTKYTSLPTSQTAPFNLGSPRR